MLYGVEDYLIDLRKFEVRQGDRVLPAEPQVLALLFLLVENRDRLVSKDELVASVWGGRAVSDSAISSRIKSARKLLGDDGESQRLIRTIHGKGYRFVAEVRVHQSGAGFERAKRIGTKPFVAVLPFDSDDPELSIIADGLPHDLIVGLSRLHSLAVIARGSSFRFRGWPYNFALVRHSLGVGYCVTGTVHRVGSKVVVAVELVDTSTNAVIWGDLHEGDLDSLNGFREAILARITCTLELQISRHEAQQARCHPSENLDAWSCYHLGLQHIFRFNRSDNGRGLDLLERAAMLDPHSSHAHAAISFARFQNAFMHYSNDAEHEIRWAKKAAETALEQDEQNPAANLMFGRSMWLEREIDNSVPWLERAIALSPSYAQAIYSRAWAEMILNHGEAGQRNARAALQLSPIDPLCYAMIAIDGFTETLFGDKTAGASLVDRAARQPRAHAMVAVMAAICHVWAGDEQRTRYWTNEAKARGPHVNGEVFLTSFPFKVGALRDRVTDALLVAGI